MSPGDLSLKHMCVGGGGGYIYGKLIIVLCAYAGAYK